MFFWANFFAFVSDKTAFYFTKEMDGFSFKKYRFVILKSGIQCMYFFDRYLLRTNLKIFSLEFFKGLHGLDSKM